MAICAAVAAVTLSLGAIGSAGRLSRRLSLISVPVPVRSVATVLMMASLLTALSRPRPATATVAPPIVRLSGEPGASPEAVPAPAAAPGSMVYVVEAGDSLWRIARHVLTERTGRRPSNGEIAAFWPVIYEANRSTIGENPNLIFPGQRFVIPEG